MTKKKMQQERRFFLIMSVCFMSFALLQWHDLFIPRWLTPVYIPHWIWLALLIATSVTSALFAVIWSILYSLERALTQDRKADPRDTTERKTDDR